MIDIVITIFAPDISLHSLLLGRHLLRVSKNVLVVRTLVVINHLICLLHGIYEIGTWIQYLGVEVLWKLSAPALHYIHKAFYWELF